MVFFGGGIYVRSDLVVVILLIWVRTRTSKILHRVLKIWGYILEQFDPNRCNDDICVGSFIRQLELSF